MIEPREFVGESLDGAIVKAGKHFGVEIEQLSVKVLSGAIEISGVGARVVILATLKEGSPPKREAVPPAERVAVKRAPRPERAAVREEQPRPERAAVEQGPPPEPGDLGPAGEFLLGLLTRMGFSSPVVHESETDGRIVLRIHDARVLEMLRRDGRVRGALAHLVGRGVQKICGPEVEVRLQTEADEGGEERLEELARERAREVMERGEEVLLPPMNSRDRWIVHDTLKTMTGVRTESVGDGRLKRVKIVLA
ncbi:MAG: R3H domain-containing nucleic acid-binding protein [Myxococcota bacterium]